MKRPPNPRAQQAAVDEWNANWNVGQRVRVTLDDGSVIETETRSEAELLGGHTAVIWVDGIAGAYRLDRCKSVAEKAAEKTAALQDAPRDPHNVFPKGRWT